MKDARFDEVMRLTCIQPFKELREKLPHHCMMRCDMDENALFIDAADGGDCGEPPLPLPDRPSSSYGLSADFAWNKSSGKSAYARWAF